MNTTSHPSIRILMFAWATLLIVGLLVALRLFFLPFVLGGLFALLIQPTIDYVEGKYDLSRNVSIGFVFGFFVMLFVGLAIWVTPKIITEFRQLQGNRDQFILSISEKYKEAKKKVRTDSPRIYQFVPWTDIETTYLKPEQWLAKDKFESIWYQITHGLEWVFFLGVLSPLVAFFILKDGSMLKHHLMHFVPNRYFEMVMELIANFNRQIVAFVRGQFWDSSINAFLLSVALTLVGLPYAILVGIFAGIANAVPIVGPIVAGSVSFLIALLTGTVNPWLILGIFLVIHIIDVVVIYPMCVGHSLRLHEFVVLLGALAGGYLAGIIGMLVAVPLLGIVIRSTAIIFRTLRGYRII